MRFEVRRTLQRAFTPAWRFGLLALVWLLLISGLHLWLNHRPETRLTLRMGYMPVITNLAAPLLDYTSRTAGAVRFEAVKFASFAEMAEALRNGHIDAAFMIAPLAIVLKQQGEDIRIVYIGNRHESTLVTRKDLKIRSVADLAGKTVAVPMRYSGHNLALLRLMESTAPDRRMRIVEMNPPDMASALATGALDAYFVGEPFAAQTIVTGEAEVLHYVEDLWPNFICNLMVVRESLIIRHPTAAGQLVSAAARAGLWAREHPAQAAEVAARYWNQPPEVIVFALTHPPGRIVFDRFVPRMAEIQEIADLMLRHGLLTNRDLGDLVDDRLALKVALGGISDLASILNPLPPP
jgi:NitT/TauT family transport system substrate-binding protein